MKKTKANSKSIIYILLLAIITAIVVSRTYARYTQSQSNESTAQVAKWSFSVNGLDNATLTRADITEGTVADNSIAPGTQGSFAVGVDARGSDVAIEYTVEISNIQDRPDNLYFYEDANCTTLMQEKGGSTGIYEFKGIISANATDAEKQNNITIYWKWEYETVATDDTTTEGDNSDTTRGKSGEPMSFDIRVVGTQYMGEIEPQYPTLASQVSVGDIVNYNAASYKAEDASKTTYTALATLTGEDTDPDKIADPTFSANDTMTWKVLSKNEATGEVKLMATTSTSLRLYGKKGYWNAVQVLNDAAEVYGYGAGAIGARSLTVEDLNPIAEAAGVTIPTPETEIEYSNGQIILYEDGREDVAAENNKITIKESYYYYEKENVFSSFIINQAPFLASCCVNTTDKASQSNCIFCIWRVNKSGIDANYLFESSNKNTIDGNFGIARVIAPMVTLKTNIKTTGQNTSGVWQLITD